MPREDTDATRTEYFLLILALILLVLVGVQGCATGYYTGDSGGAEAASARTGRLEAKSISGSGAKEQPRAGMQQEEQPAPQAGQLTAGRWRDLDHWDFWTRLINGPEHGWKKWAERWKLNPRGRVSVVVHDKKGRPVVDASVKLLDRRDDILWETRTDNRGRATLFASLFDHQPRQTRPSLRVSASSETYSQDPIGYGIHEVTLPTTPEVPRGVDVMLTVDTTGSMSDELRYLKSELSDVIERVQRGTDDELSIRTSVNFYRDRGDAYVLRSKPFTSRLARSVRQIGQQRARGGGNYPEAVDRALADAIEDHDWRTSARARLLFLVLDAPPHHNQQVITSLQRSLRAATRKGVRIVPVAASGVDEETEFLLRTIAIATGAPYTFLTDHSGIGADHREPTIGDYRVRNLNDLIVEIIAEYVAAPGHQAGLTR